MATKIETPQITTSAQGAPVATYRDVRGAALALSELAARGVDTTNVRVRPVGVAPVEGSLVQVARRPRRRRALLVGAAAAIAVLALAGPSLTSVLLAAAVAVVAAWSTLGVEDLRRAWLCWRARRKANVVRAERFEIVCSERADRIAHVLASWWDPEAPAASPRTVTRS